MKRLVVGLFLAWLVAGVAADTNSPYVGQEQRAIKSLSPEEVEGYLEGKGLGYAKAAELNHYPGPLHVLEMADQLGLSASQLAQTQEIFAAMKQQAMQMGRQLVDQEQKLDLAFASGSMKPESLLTLVRGIGELEADIRYAHLSAHLEQKAVLTRHQVLLYDKLRGYGMSDHVSHDHQH